MTEEATIRAVKWTLAKLPFLLFLSAYLPTIIYEDAPTTRTATQTVDVYLWGAVSRLVTPWEALAFYVMYFLAFILVVGWLYGVAIKWRDDKSKL